MRASVECRELIQAWEGIEDGDPSTTHLEPYICPANIYTVGWGHALKTSSGQNIDIDTFGPVRARELAQNAMLRKFGTPSIGIIQAEALLGEDLHIYERAVATAISQSSPATQQQFDALVSFCFNVGGPNMRGSSVIRLHNAGHRTVGDVDIPALYRASVEKHQITDIEIAFVRWAMANGRWMLGLWRRRISELLLYAGHDVSTAIRHGMKARS